MAASVVLRMTGLLLLSDGPDEVSPVYVLFPATHPGMDHDAEIGYFPSDRSALVDSDGILWKDITDFSIELGRSGYSINPTLPEGNVSTSVDRPVHPGHYGSKRRPELKARLILHEGRISDTCRLGFFTLRGQEIRLANVVEWTLPNPSGDKLTVKGQRMTPTGLGKKEELFTVEARNGRIELFLRHTPPPGSEPPDPKPGQPPYHWRMLFQLLDPPPAKDDAPLFVRSTTTAACHFKDPGGRNIGTLSCPVGVGNPP